MPDDSPEIAAEDFDQKWVPPVLLIERLGPLVRSGQTAVSEILERLTSGALQAAAGSAKFVSDGSPVNPTLTRIPASFWDTAEGISPAHADFWRTGTLVINRVRTPSGLAPTTISFFDVRFDPVGIEQIAAIRAASLRAAVSAQPGPVVAPPVRAGGRPRKDYWEDLIIEMARQIYEAEISPKLQADLERAMLDWIVMNGHKGDESSVRPRAKKLFDALCRKG